jgi:hypothetical protein
MRCAEKRLLQFRPRFLAIWYTAGAEEVTHTLESEAQSARYRVAVLAGDGSRLGAGPWTYIAGAQDLDQYSAEAFR